MATEIKISLEAARVNAGLTQEAVAEHMGKAKATIIAWEKGKTKIPAFELSKLSDLYNIPMDYIFLP